ncbi:Rz1-like lysis system protein LysC [Bordetella genomosp. 9]|uniref:Rz1-like lysis system protein LysC n=1 Tax=Bordetella genomosp. 9 TaxID=1416803 RepID=UPI001177336D
MRWKRTGAGLTLLCLTLCLTACSVAPLPPAEYLEDCLHAEPPQERTNGALADFAQRERLALDLCNADKAALRAWSAKLAH